MTVDEQFLDKFTQTDNLIALLTNAQVQTNQLLQKQNFLLEELLRKPTVLEAPQLRDVTIQDLSKTSDHAKNLDLIPQLLWDINAKKYYMLKGSFIISGFRDLAGSGTDDTTFVVSDLIQGVGKLWLNNFKIIGYGLIDTTLSPVPIDARVTFIIDDKPVVSVFAQEKIVVPYPSDPHDQSFYLNAESKFRTIVANQSSYVIRVYIEQTFFLYNEIAADFARSIMVEIQNFVS